MDILETAIAIEGGVTKLADALQTRQSTVSNWRARGVPKPWRLVLLQRYESSSEATNQKEQIDVQPSL